MSAIIPEVKRYLDRHSPYYDDAVKRLEHDAMEYWKYIYKTGKTATIQRLAEFAIAVLQIVPHAAGIESLFSIMTNIKTKVRGGMSVQKLKNYAQVKESLSEGKQNARKGDTVIVGRTATQGGKVSRTEQNLENEAELSLYARMQAYDDLVSSLDGAMTVKDIIDSMPQSTPEAETELDSAESDSPVATSSSNGENVTFVNETREIAFMETLFNFDMEFDDTAPTVQQQDNIETSPAEIPSFEEIWY